MTSLQINITKIVSLFLGFGIIFLALPGSPVWDFFRSDPETTTVLLPNTGGNSPGGSDSVTPSQPRQLDIISILPKDAIPAILDPTFITRAEADDTNAMQDGELVLGVSLNGEHHAFSIPFLSRHEVVNDVVGGVPLAVTW